MASSPLFIKFKDTYSLLSYATEVIGIHEGFRSKRYKDRITRCFLYPAATEAGIMYH